MNSVTQLPLSRKDGVRDRIIEDKEKALIC